jgi:RNA polymerase sporulation-specific sigma factor
MNRNFPAHIQKKVKENKDYYSLYVMNNIIKAKEDSDYCGELLIANEYLLWFSIHKYIGNVDKIVSLNRLEKDDIIQLARLAFLKCIKVYDVTRGVKFSSYLVTAVVREVRSYLRDISSLIRLPREKQKMIGQFRDFKDGLISYEEFKERSIVDVTQEEMLKILNIRDKMLSFEDIMVSNSFCQNIKVEDMLNDHRVNVEGDVIDSLFIKDMFKWIFLRLTDQEKKILRGKFRGDSQTKIAKDNNISHIKVTRAVKKIFKMMESYKKQFA